MRKGEKKVVVDTSVVVASVLGEPEAAPARVVRAMLTGAFRAYSSREAVEELYEVLTSEKLTRLLRGRIEVAILTYVLVNSTVTLVEPKKHISACRDPDDNKFIVIIMTPVGRLWTFEVEKIHDKYFVTLIGDSWSINIENKGGKT